MRTHGPWLIPFVVALAASATTVGGCRDNPAIDGNATPVAVAWVADADFPIPRDLECLKKRKAEKSDEPCPIDEESRRMGCSVVNEDTGACEKFVEFADAPVTVTLDAKYSSDRDGEVTKYRWLSANFGPDCKGRGGIDPKDKQKPQVTLDEGFWEFGLWVEDEHGAVSSQSVVTIKVGANSDDPCPNGPTGSGGAGGAGGDEDAGAPDAGGVDPAAQLACVMDCASKSCPTESAACDGNPMCWPLVSCVAQKCADATDTASVTSCAIAMCAEFLPGATEGQAVANCALACRDGDCAM